MLKAARITRLAYISVVSLLLEKKIIIVLVLNKTPKQVFQLHILPSPCLPFSRDILFQPSFPPPHFETFCCQMPSFAPLLCKVTPGASAHHSLLWVGSVPCSFKSWIRMEAEPRSVLVAVNLSLRSYADIRISV